MKKLESSSEDGTYTKTDLNNMFMTDSQEMKLKNPVYALEIFATRIFRDFPDRFILPGVQTQSCLEMYFGKMKMGQREMSEVQWDRRLAADRWNKCDLETHSGNDGSTDGYDRNSSLIRDNKASYVTSRSFFSEILSFMKIFVFFSSVSPHCL
jgi:hypothetical protein